MRQSEECSLCVWVFASICCSLMHTCPHMSIRQHELDFGFELTVFHVCVMFGDSTSFVCNTCDICDGGMIFSLVD